MFINRILHKQMQRGALFIEYALVLAFVVAAGLIFLSSEGMPKSVARIFGNANDTLEIAANDGKPVDFMKGDVIVLGGSIDGKTGLLVPGNAYYQMAFFNKDGKLYSLEPNSTYEFTIDTSKAGDLSFTGDKEGFYFTAQLFANNSDGTYNPLLDSPRNTFAPSSNQSALKVKGVYYNSQENALNLPSGDCSIYATSNDGKITYTITTGSQEISLGGNIVHGSTAANATSMSDKNREDIQNFVSDGFSLKKVK